MVTGAVHRDGKSRLGCLLTVAVLGAIVYFGWGVAQVYLRFYEFQDDMAQEVRFAARTPDDTIILTLRAKADSLGLPDDAQRVKVKRKGHQIWIWADYVETIELPGRIETLDLAPHAEGSF